MGLTFKDAVVFGGKEYKIQCVEISGDKFWEVSDYLNQNQMQYQRGIDKLFVTEEVATIVQLKFGNSVQE
jgi:hypothetical protein